MFGWQVAWCNSGTFLYELTFLTTITKKAKALFVDSAGGSLYEALFETAGTSSHVRGPFTHTIYLLCLCCLHMNLCNTAGKEQVSVSDAFTDRFAAGYVHIRSI